MLHSRSSKRQQRLTSALRYAGNALLVIGHFTLLWGDTEPALVVKIIGALCILPFAFVFKLWDVVALECLLGGLDATKLVQLLFGSS